MSLGGQTQMAWQAEILLCVPTPSFRWAKPSGRHLLTLTGFLESLPL